MITKISYSVERLKYQERTKNFFARCSEKTLHSLRTANTISHIVCVGTGKAGEINKLLTSLRHNVTVKRATLAGSGVLTLTGDSESPTVTTKKSSITRSSLIGSGSWNKRTLYGKGEPSFTGSKIAGTQKL